MKLVKNPVRKRLSRRGGEETERERFWGCGSLFCWRTWLRRKQVRIRNRRGAWSTGYPGGSRELDQTERASTARERVDTVPRLAIRSPVLWGTLGGTEVSRGAEAARGMGYAGMRTLVCPGRANSGRPFHCTQYRG